jgi:hypothetical protein
LTFQPATLFLQPHHHGLRLISMFCPAEVVQRAEIGHLLRTAIQTEWAQNLAQDRGLDPEGGAGAEAAEEQRAIR